MNMYDWVKVVDKKTLEVVAYGILKDVLYYGTVNYEFIAI